MKSFLILIIIIIVFFTSCNDNKIKTVVAKPTIETPNFDADSAYSFVAKQVAFGPRVPESKAHKECSKWLNAKMLEYTKTVTIQNFNATLYNNKTVKGKNIIASFNPENKVRIVLAAHWDSRPFADHDADIKNANTPIDGANDGASGVGVLIEVARQLNIKKPNIGVDIIFFDVEDYGEPQGTKTEREDNWCLGSQYWAKNPHIQGYKARFGILLDMVGGRNAEFAKEGYSMKFAPDYMNKVWYIANNLGFASYFIDKVTDEIIDDHLYVNVISSIPMIDIIEYNANTKHHFNANWHTLKDNINNVDKQTLSVVGKVCLAVIYQE